MRSLLNRSNGIEQRAGVSKHKNILFLSPFIFFILFVLLKKSNTFSCQLRKWK